MHKLSFTKMNGAGNDFVMLDNRSGELTLDTPAIARLCDRHRGVGADGVLLVERSDDPDAAYRMRYHNADGGEAEMCGNGARCFARFATRLEADGNGDSRERGHLTFITRAGLIRAHLDGELVRLEMSRPTDGKNLGELAFDDGKLPRAFFLNTGVPHVVVPVADTERVDVHLTGRSIRYHARFAPKGTNANFIASRGPDDIVLRTYERGVEGETLACGTGATAAALIHAEMRGVEGAGMVAVEVRSGDVLHIGFERTGPFQFEHVTLGRTGGFRVQRRDRGVRWGVFYYAIHRNLHRARHPVPRRPD